MVAKIIIIIGTVFGLFYSISRRESLPIIISAGMAMGVAIALLASTIYRPVGFIAYMVSVLIAALYAIVTDGLVIRGRIFILLTCAAVFTYWLFAINHWHGNLWLFMIVPVIVFIWWLVCKVPIKKELGFIIIMVADALAVAFEYWANRW
jgi:hypothetical protein